MTLPLRAVLFDLDGTLLDTAPDMIGALNTLRGQESLPELPTPEVRSVVSHGAARLVKMGFPEADAEAQLKLQRRFLDIYRGALSRGTRLFPGMDQVLASLAQRGVKLGIVTNKPAWLTEPLLEELALRPLFACVVSGDSVAERKPHPMPMLHAAALAGVAAGECIYVGDAERDVQAAHAAAMPALVANYGYLRDDEDSSAWGGDGYLSAPLDILDWIHSSGRL